jgi:hypothetical protein
MLTDFEKSIYNKHLASYKKAQNKPFNFKKNFENLDDSTIFYIKKLSLFFNKFKNIKIVDFFVAPYKIYPDEKFFELKFYISSKAIKAYTLFCKKINVQNPDSDEILERTLNSLKFLKKFCKTNKISIKNYLDYTLPGASVPVYIEHLHNHDINFYVCFGFRDFLVKINKNYESYKFILGDSIDNLSSFYNLFIKSAKLKVLVREGINKIG